MTETVRKLTAEQREGTPVWSQTQERAYAYPIEQLWQKITRADELSNWFSPVSGDLRLRGRYQIDGNASGTITACKELEHYALTWEFADNTSWVDVRLSCPDGSTRLALTHVAQIPDEFWNEYGPGATGVGWDLTFEALQQHLDGQTLDQIQAWPGTAPGLEFIHRSSTAWGQAAIDAGIDPQDARAAALRTAKFYGYSET